MKGFEKCTVLGVEYRSTTINGNNSYWLDFLNSEGHSERGYTMPDSSCGRIIRNYRHAEGKPIFLDYRCAKGGKCIIGGIRHNTPDEAEKYARTPEKRGGGIWQEKDF